MKKTLLSLLLILCTVGVISAESVDYDFSNPTLYGFTPSSEPSTGVDVPTGSKLVAGTGNNAVTMTIDNKSANTTKFWTGSEAQNKAVELRIYSGATFTISSNATITSVMFEGNGNTAISSSEGTFNSGIWAGNSKSITFTATGSLKLSSMEVTLLGTDEILAPFFTPSGNIYYGPVTVEINCKDPNPVKIYYTLDGTTPTTASTLYEAPIKITTTSVLKAVATYNGISSSITEAYYGIEAPSAEVANIAEYLATNTTGKPDGKAIKITNPVTVSYAGINKTNNYLYLFDESGALSVYLKGAEFSYLYKNGDQIPGGIVGNITFNGGEPQMQPSIPSFGAPLSNSPVEPKAVEISDITSALDNQYILLEGVTVDATAKKLVKGDKSFNYYLRFDGVAPTSATTPVNVAGIVNTYSGAIQLYPTDFNYSAGVENPVATDAASILGGNGEIKVVSDQRSQVLIANSIGQIIVNKPVEAGKASFAVPTGFYVVKVGAKTAKILVK